MKVDRHAPEPAEEIEEMLACFSAVYGSTDIGRLGRIIAAGAGAAGLLPPSASSCSLSVLRMVVNCDF